MSRRYAALLAFFEPPPPPGPESELEFSESPPWWGPASNVVGASVPLAPLVLAKTDRAAVAIVGATAYPTGFKVFLTARVRGTELRRLRARGRDFLMMQRLHSFGSGGELPDELLRFGIQFADGRKATSLDGFPDHDDEPAGPTLVPGGGGGGPTAWNQGFWIWPLPPPGPLAFVCEWPAFGISFTKAEADATLVLEAAKRTQVLWPDESRTDGASELRGWFSSS